MPGPGPGGRATRGYVAIEALRAGDVLLSRGTGDISRWMAWNGGSPYSHAALLVDEGGAHAPQCVEAVAPRVRRLSLLRHVGAHHDLLDVYRPCLDGGQALGAEDRRRIARIASIYVGRRFASGRMLPLALRTWLRWRCPRTFATWNSAVPSASHDPGTPCLRRMLPTAADITCVELVYRVLDAAVGLKPCTNGAASPRTMPRPPLHPGRLLQEYRRYRAAGAAYDVDPESGLESASMASVARIDRLVEDARDCPADLLPRDLIASPTLRRLGRLR